MGKWFYYVDWNDVVDKNILIPKNDSITLSLVKKYNAEKIVVSWGHWRMMARNGDGLDITMDITMQLIGKDWVFIYEWINKPYKD